MQEIARALQLIVSGHTLITMPGIRCSYLVFEVFRPLPREDGRIAFLIRHTGRGKQVAPFQEMGELPAELKARLPTEAEYDAAAAAVGRLLEQTFASIA